MKKLKRLLIVIVGSCLLLSLSACNDIKNDTEAQTTLLEEDQEKLDREKIVEIMETFAKLESEGNYNKIYKYIDENAKIVGKEKASKMVLSLEDILEKNIYTYEEKLNSQENFKEISSLSDESIFLNEKNIHTLANKDLEKLISNILDSGYKIRLGENKIHVSVNYDELLKFGPDSLESTSNYLNIMANYIDNPNIINGQISLSYDELAARVMKLESFITEYPESSRREDILKLYRQSLTDYLIGSEKTPISNNGGLNKDLLNSYKNTSKLKEGISPAIIRKYLSLITDENILSKDDRDVYILSLINEALSYIEEKVW